MALDFVRSELAFDTLPQCKEFVVAAHGVVTGAGLLDCKESCVLMGAAAAE